MSDFPFNSIQETIFVAVAARETLGAAIAKGESEEKVLTEFVARTLATAVEQNSLVPVSALLDVSREYPQLGNLVLEASRLAGGPQAALLALALSGRYDPADEEHDVPDEAVTSWISWWWAQAACGERLEYVTRVTDDAPPWSWPLIVDGISTGEESLVKAASDRVTHVMAMGNYTNQDMGLIVESLAKWLKGSRAQQNAAERLVGSAVVQRQLGGCGDDIVKIVLARMADVPNTQDSQAKAPARHIGSLVREVVSGRRGRPDGIVDFLAQTPKQWLGAVVKSLLDGGGTPVNWVEWLEGSQRTVVRQLITSTVLNGGLRDLDGRYGSWILTDPSGTALHADTLIPHMAFSCAVVAAEAWPTEKMPQLLERFKIYSDATFLPILAAVVRRHKRVVDAGMFQRLAISPEAEFRVIAVLHLDAVADSVEEVVGEPMGKTQAH